MPTSPTPPAARTAHDGGNDMSDLLVPSREELLRDAAALDAMAARLHDEGRCDAVVDVVPATCALSVEPPGVVPRDDSGHLVQRLVALAASAFGVCTVAINLCDVASDVVVAVEFYQAGRMLWFWLVVSALIIASVVYALFAAVIGGDHGEMLNNVRSFALRFLIILPVAQLFPLLRLVHKKRIRSSYNSMAYYDRLSHNARVAAQQREQAAFRRASAAAKEELSDALQAKALEDAVSDSFRAHMDKYGAFYIESFVEALPMAVVQLVAMSVLGEASWAQIVSVCLSLLSITSKALYYCKTIDVKVIAFRFLLCAHDVLSTFYLFASILSRDAPHETTFFGLPVTYLAYVWGVKALVWSAFAFAGWAGFWLKEVIVDGGGQPQERVALLLMTIVGLGPGCIVAELCRLSAVSLWLSHTRLGLPSKVTAMVYTFVKSAPTGAERARRLDFTFNRVLDMPSRWMHSASRCAPAACRDLQGHAYTRPATAALRRELASPWWFWVLRRHAFQYGDRAARLLPATWRIVRWQPRQRGESHVLSLCGTAAVVAFVLCQGFSFLYPFLNTALYWQSHTPLQLVFLTGAMATLLGALPLLPAALDVLAFQLAFQLSVGGNGTPLESVLDALTAYHLPPVSAALQSMIPAPVLPADLCDVVGGFLTADDVGLRALTLAETSDVAAYDHFGRCRGEQDADDEVRG